MFRIIRMIICIPPRITVAYPCTSFIYRIILQACSTEGYLIFFYPIRIIRILLMVGVSINITFSSLIIGPTDISTSRLRAVISYFITTCFRILSIFAPCQFVPFIIGVIRFRLHLLKPKRCSVRHFLLELPYRYFDCRKHYPES